MGIFDFLKKNQTRNKSVNAIKLHNDKQEQHNDKQVNLSVQLSTSSYEVDCFLAPGEEVSRLNLSGYENPSGGFVNFSCYKVVGRNNTSGRKNTKHYVAKDEDSSVKLAKEDGLSEPFEISIEPHKRDIESENYFISQLHNYRVPVPEGAIKEDLRNILDRVRYSTLVVTEEKVGKNKIIQTVRAIPGPNEEFATFADEMGVKFSLYISETALLNSTVCALSDRDKAAFFAYCILCSKDRSPVRDPRQSEYAEKLYAFADVAVRNAQLMKSINGRDPSDYQNPHKGSIAYKAVADYFDL